MVPYRTDQFHRIRVIARSRSPSHQQLRRKLAEYDGRRHESWSRGVADIGKGDDFVSVTGGFGLIRPVRLFLMVTAR